MRFVVVPLLLSLLSPAQQRSASTPVPGSSWLNAQSINFAALTSGPPGAGSDLDRQDLEDVLSAQGTRTAAQILQAKADDKEEDIFIFASILGPQFNATNLPITAALSQHLRDASAVVNPTLKTHFKRPRPFVASAQVHPVCEQTKTDSFPSGHTMVAVLEAFALTQIVPERSGEVLHRLDQYVHNRVVCGVHYPSDVAASRVVASSLFGLIAASPAFQRELESARREVRNHLGLSLSPAVGPLAENYLANNTVLIVRHAEKPAESTGQPGLTETGRRRAQAYVRYFQPFVEGGEKLTVSALIAGADSFSSIRPRLTLEPLSQASGISLDTSVSTKDPASLISNLRNQPHGTTPLICWRHGQIPALLTQFGVVPESLLPAGKWPDDVYDWVIVLRFDGEGRLASQKLLHESLHIP